MANTTTDQQIYSRREYFTDITQRINQTQRGSRVLVASMGIRPDEPEVVVIIEALAKAAQRGAIVSLLVDAYDYLIDDRKGQLGSLWRRKALPAKPRPNEQAHLDMLAYLRKAGVICVVTNMPSHAFSNPFAGRSHIKTTVVDDYLYIGGCNLHEVNQLDLMIGWHDRNAADWLYNKMQQIVQQPFTKKVLGKADQQYNISPSSTLILDSGAKRQSRIMDTALQVIDNAQEWVVLTTQFLPDRSAKHLAAALKRGVKVYSIFNNYHQFKGVNYVAQQSIKQIAKMHRPHSLFAYELPADLPFLHAKVLATEKEFMLGSHNYLQIGVNFGTAELSLHQKDPLVSKRVAQAIIAQCSLGTQISLPG